MQNVRRKYKIPILKIKITKEQITNNSQTDTLFQCEQVMKITLKLFCILDSAGEMKQLIIANVSQDNHVAGCSSQRLEIQFNKVLPKVEPGLAISNDNAKGEYDHGHL